MLALGSAQRTSEAFDRYLERANVGDVVVNPSVSSTEVDSIIRSLPGDHRDHDGLVVHGQPRRR